MADDGPTLNKIHSMKCDQLKMVLRECKGRVSGNKRVLIERCRNLLANPTTSASLVQAADRVFAANPRCGYAPRSRYMGMSTSAAAAHAVAAAAALPRSGGYGLAFLDQLMATEAASTGMQPLPLPPNPFLDNATTVFGPKFLINGSLARSGRYVWRSFEVRFSPQQMEALTSGQAHVFLRCTHYNRKKQTVNETFPNHLSWAIDSTNHLPSLAGRSRPYDISDLYHGRATMRLSVGVGHELHKNLFYHYMAAVCVAQPLSVEELMGRLPVLDSSVVLAQIKEKLDVTDDDIIPTKTFVSLQCPIGVMRMSTPVRGTKCAHIQCFDALFYLKVNERKAGWNCPVCNRPTPPSELRIDGYFRDLLLQVEASASDLEILPDGSWLTRQVDAVGICSDDDEDDESFAVPLPVACAAVSSSSSSAAAAAAADGSGSSVVAGLNVSAASIMDAAFEPLPGLEDRDAGFGFASQAAVDAELGMGVLDSFAACAADPLVVTFTGLSSGSGGPSIKRRRTESGHAEDPICLSDDDD